MEEKKLLQVITLVWAVFLLPSVVLIIFAAQGVITFAGDSPTQQFLYYNVLAFPVVLVVSIGMSWWLWSLKKEKAALAFALLPLASVFVEIIAADVVLLLQ